MQQKLTSIDQIGTVLRGRRKELKLSQEQLGFSAGIHRTVIAQIESGQREARLGTLLKLITALGLDLQLTERGAWPDA